MSLAAEGERTLMLIDHEPQAGDFLAEVLAGFTQSPRRLPCKYFYDHKGSLLFDAICELPEYYPTRTELGVMREHLAEMADVIGPRVQLVEFGSGSSLKTRLLLRRLREPGAYVPIEISRTHLLASARRLARQFPRLAVTPVCADYTQDLSLPELGPVQRRVIYFPGSTIGNFTRAEAAQFLARLATLAGPAGGLLIGVDLRKSPDVLLPAYNDAQGVTAEFNLNLLDRIHSELDSDIDRHNFRHEAIWNDADSRIEMHLVSLCDHDIRLAGQRFHLAAGERLITEYSHKYALDDFEQLAAPWRVQRVWSDPQSWFAVLWMTTA